MPDVQRPWTASESLSDLSLYADWDSVASMAMSLRIHLFEYGTIPTWNFTMCGGQPELSTPFSWVFTWPSLFAYLLPPNQAIIGVWLTLTIIGFVSMGALLRALTRSPAGSAIGALLYVSSGIFVTAFSLGHVSWAFFHLVPLMMWLFLRAFGRIERGDRANTLLLLTTLGSFFFFTSALPHGLLHLYPAFLLLVGFRCGGAARVHGWRRSLGIGARPGAAHLLGMWMAAYKLWPAIRWQLEYPRPGVMLEARSLETIFYSTVSWDTSAIRYASAYLGPFAWLLCILAVYVAARKLRAKAGSERTGMSTTAYALVLLGAGVTLSLGNNHPLSPGSLFSHFPVLDGVRGFLRYQILIALGVAILVSQSFAILTKRLGPGWARRVGVGLASTATLAPVLVQGALVIWNIDSRPNAELFGPFEPNLPRQPGPPVMAVAPFVRFYPLGMWSSSIILRPRQQTTLLRHGLWIANCRTDLSLPHRFFTVPRPNRRSNWTKVVPYSMIPLSHPPPLKIEGPTRDSLTLIYPDGLQEEILLNLIVLDSFELNGTSRADDSGRVRVDPRSLAGNRLTIRAVQAGVREGFLVSLTGLVASGLFFMFDRRRAPV